MADVPLKDAAKKPIRAMRQSREVGSKPRPLRRAGRRRVSAATSGPPPVMRPGARRGARSTLTVPSPLQLGNIESRPRGRRVEATAERTQRARDPARDGLTCDETVERRAEPARLARGSRCDYSERSGGGRKAARQADPPARGEARERVGPLAGAQGPLPGTEIFPGVCYCGNDAATTRRRVDE